MDKAIQEHECFKRLFEVVPGAKRSLDIPIQFDMKTGQLYTEYWAFSVFSKEKGNKTTRLFISFCPMCGQSLAPEVPHGSENVNIPEENKEN